MSSLTSSLGSDVFVTAPSLGSDVYATAPEFTQQSEGVGGGGTSSSLTVAAATTAEAVTKKSQTKDQNENESENEDDPIRHLYKTTHSELTNLGKALTCPICQSTYHNNVVILPCVHAYCRPCITQALRHKEECPICKTKATKRGLVDCPLLGELAIAYKKVTRSLGWAPSVYSNQVNMTQLPPPSSLPFGGGGKEEEKTDMVECHEQLQAAKVWQRALNTGQDNDIIQQERAKVVQINQQAMVQAAVKKKQNAQKEKEKKMKANDDDEFSLRRVDEPSNSQDSSSSSQPPLSNIITHCSSVTPVIGRAKKPPKPNNIFTWAGDNDTTPKTKKSSFDSSQEDNNSDEFQFTASGSVPSSFPSSLPLLDNNKKTANAAIDKDNDEILPPSLPNNKQSEEEGEGKSDKSKKTDKNTRSRIKKQAAIVSPGNTTTAAMRKSKRLSTELESGSDNESSRKRTRRSTRGSTKDDNAEKLSGKPASKIPPPKRRLRTNSQNDSPMDEDQKEDTGKDKKSNVNTESPSSQSSFTHLEKSQSQESQPKGRKRLTRSNSQNSNSSKTKENQSMKENPTESSKSNESTSPGSSSSTQLDKPLPEPKGRRRLTRNNSKNKSPNSPSNNENQNENKAEATPKVKNKSAIKSSVALPHEEVVAEEIKQRKRPTRSNSQNSQNSPNEVIPPHRSNRSMANLQKQELLHNETCSNRPTKKMTRKDSKNSKSSKNENVDNLQKAKKVGKRKRNSERSTHDSSPTDPKDLPAENPDKTTNSPAAKKDNSFVSEVVDNDNTDVTGNEIQEEVTGKEGIAADDSNRNVKVPKKFTVGVVVQVEARTWPGINKHGGVGRITKVYEDDDAVYDVAYILGGKEKRVDAIYISLVNNDEDEDASEPTPTRRTKAMKKKMKQRAAQKKDEIPVCVLQALAADGFDISNQQKEPKFLKQSEITARAVSSPKRNQLSPKKKSSPKKKLPHKATKKNTKHKLDAKKKKKVAVKKGTNNATKKKKVTIAPCPPTKKIKQQPIILPALNRDEKCNLADKHYKLRFESAMKNGIIYVVSSSLKEEDKENLSILVKSTKKHDVSLRLSETFNPKKTTLVLMPSGSESHAVARSRTLKVMRAALAGVPIVTPNWITSCLKQNALTIPTEDMYIRSLPTKSDTDSEYGVAFLAARHQLQVEDENTLAAPLQQNFVYLHGNFVAPSRGDIQLLLRESGATMLPGWDAVLKKKKNNKVVLLLCNEYEEIPPEKQEEIDDYDSNISIATANWLFDSISCGEPLPENHYYSKPTLAAESQVY